MFKFLFAAYLTLLISACTFTTSTKENVGEALHQNAMQDMVDTDRAFSEDCLKNGMKKSFLEFVADDAVLLRPDQLPIVDGDVIKFLSAQEDTSFTMSWEPSGADLSASNDMGYTYGVYTVVTKDTTLKGTYLSIWKKQINGKWKFVLDTGNQGTGELKTEE